MGRFLVTLLVYLPGNSSNNNLIKVCQRPEYMHEENWLQFDVQILFALNIFRNICCKNIVECPHQLHTAPHTIICHTWNGVSITITPGAE